MIPQLQCRQSINWAGELPPLISRLCERTVLFQHCISFLSLEERALTSSVSCAFNRTVTRSNAMLLAEHASLIEPIIRFCVVLERKIEVRLLRSFKECNSLADVYQRIDQIKKHMIIDLSQFENNQLINLRKSCFEVIKPAGFYNVFNLAIERRNTLTKIQQGCASMALSTIEFVDDFFKDDIAIVHAYIERYKGLKSCVHVWNLTSERLRGKEALVLRVLRECPQARGITMYQYMSKQLQNDIGFMEKAKSFIHLPEAIQRTARG